MPSSAGKKKRQDELAERRCRGLVAPQQLERHFANGFERTHVQLASGGGGCRGQRDRAAIGIRAQPSRGRDRAVRRAQLASCSGTDAVSATPAIRYASI